MKRIHRYIYGAALAPLAFAGVNRAQDFKLFDRTVQVHGFASQGFAYSDHNNFLTMNTSNGSPAFTDGVLNASFSITDKFRVSAQGYSSKVGQLDDFRPELDFAFGDYRFAPWFGVRAGRVKTAIGLYNDTQDAEFLYTWALLPQGVYPVDLRNAMIAHDGVDIYGRVSLKNIGKLNYTAYAGKRTFDDRGGYYVFASDLGMPIASESGRAAGWDLRWSTPLKGLTLGSSWTDLTQDRKGIFTAAGFVPGAPYTGLSDPQRTAVGYGDFQRGKWDFSGEYRASDYWLDIHVDLPGVPPFPWNGSNECWFLASTYQATKRISVGVYHSNLHVDAPWNPADTASNHVYDEVGAFRFDINRFWTAKAEGHFMDGYGDIFSTQGFYQRSNPDGLKPKTNMLVLRTSMTF
jgi:hypothetical protein